MEASCRLYFLNEMYGYKKQNEFINELNEHGHYKTV